MTLFFETFLMILLAEMGDKSQFLMIAMAAQFRAGEILAGSTAAILSLNLLAAAAGRFLGDLLPTAVIALISGTAFLLFALLGMREDAGAGKAVPRVRWAVPAIFGTYFLAELGDKTQFAVLTLAAGTGEAGFSGVLPVFAGASAGLLAADALGLLLGAVLGKKLPEKTFRALSSLLFAACGAVRLFAGWEELFAQTAHPLLCPVLLTSGAVAAVVLLAARQYLRTAKKASGRAEIPHF